MILSDLRKFALFSTFPGGSSQPNTNKQQNHDGLNQN
jgi:hypothetical protein